MNIKLNKYPSYLDIISLLILTSAFKTFGYVTLFFLLIPFLVLKFKLLNNFLVSSDIKIKYVSFIFLLLIINSFIGAIRINDLRIIIFWVPYFFTCMYAYIFHNYKLENNQRYKHKIKDILFSSSIIYFIIYIFMNILSLYIYGNWYDIQINSWIGGASSFCISSLFLTQLFDRWSTKEFEIFSSYSILIILYSVLININNSNLGLVYLILFSFFIFLKSIYQRKLLRGFVILTIIIFSYNSFSIFFNEINMEYVNHENPYVFKLNDKKSIAKNVINPEESIITDLKSLNKNISSGKNLINKEKNYENISGRYFELSVGINKFLENSFIEKLFGSGWYTSRITINSTRNKMIDQYNLNERLTKKDVTQLQGIVALLLDTGLTGLLCIIFLFGLTFNDITKSEMNYINKTFYSFILLVHFLCLFIGYPIVMTSYVLIFLPKGLLFINKKGINTKNG